MSAAPGICAIRERGGTAEVSSRQKSMKTVLIPLSTRRSDRHDLLCPDGEIAATTGFPDNDTDNDSADILSPIPWDGRIPDPGYPDFPANPYPKLEAVFSLRRVGLPPYSPSGSDFPALKTAVKATLDDDEKPREAGKALSAVLADAGLAGLHTRPFLAYAAWRLDDGSHVMPTPPVLLLPNAGNILMRVLEGEASGDSRTIIFTPLIALCELGVSIPALAPTIPGDVRAIDIFISDPLPYADTENPPSGPVTFNASATFSLSALSWGGDTRTHPDADRERGYLFPALPPSDNLSRLLAASFHHVASLPLSAVGGGFMPAQAARGACAVPDYLCHAVLKPEGCCKVGNRLAAWGGSVSYPAAHMSMPAAPPFLFHPDPGCDAVALECGDTGKTLRYPLRRHPSLHGSYYFGGFAASAPTEEWSGVIPVARRVSAPGMLAMSRSGRQTVFEASMTDFRLLPEIRGASEAHKISTMSGYGGRMLYCLTAEGVYLAGIAEGGPWRVLGMLGGQRCSGVMAEMENGVAFVASGGIYMAQPTRIVCISDALAGVVGDGKWHGWLDTVRLGYDYGHRRLIAVGEDGDGGRSAYAWMSGGAVWMPLRRQVEGEVSVATFVTRPLKLGDGGERKRVVSIGVYGGEVAGWRLEGSDNLTYWEEEASGAGYVEGLCGMPRRFWRVSATLRTPVTPAGLFLRISYVN